VKCGHTIPPSGVPLIHSPVGLISLTVMTPISKSVITLMDRAPSFMLIMGFYFPISY
jgi:hypothetical protein